MEIVMTITLQHNGNVVEILIDIILKLVQLN